MLTVSLLATIVTTSLFARASALVNEYVTRENFDEFLNLNDRHLVLFTSRSLASVQSDTAVFKYADRSSSTRFTTVDCDTEIELCKDYDINSYPTIRLFELSEDEQSMETIRYRGPRTEVAIRGFVKRRELPVVTIIESSKLEDFKLIDDTVVIAYLPSDDSNLLEAFTSVAQRYYQSYVFGYTTDDSLAAIDKISVPSIKVFKNTDNYHRVLSGPFSQTSLSDYLEGAIPPLIRNFKEKELEVFMQRDKLTVYLFTAAEEQASALRRDLTPLAQKYEKFVTFAVADLAKHGDMARNFLAQFEGGERMTERIKTSVVVHAPLNDNVFSYEPGKQVQPEAVQKMLITILQGKAKNGDVFGREAPDLDGEGGEGEHDEL